jgi:AcrR family transcriptional regulator
MRANIQALDFPVGTGFYPAAMPSRRQTPRSDGAIDAGGRRARSVRQQAAAPSPSVTPATKEQLILTAERLFAVHGIDAVSLRQISVEAGNANNSAVQYHFGSKDGLVQAILENRIPHLTRRRRLLEAEAGARGDGDELRRCLECYFLPVVEEAEAEDGYYLMFLAQLQRYGIGETPFDRLPESFQTTTREFTRRVASLVGEIPESVRWTRVYGAMTICLHTSADRQRSRRNGAPVLPYVLHVANLFDGLLGFLRAPVSDATLRALAATGGTGRSGAPERGDPSI